MADIDAKSLVFGMVIVIILILIIWVIKKYNTNTAAFGKLARTFTMQQAFNSEPESFTDRGARFLKNGFDYLTKQPEEKTGIAAQSEKLVQEATQKINDVVTSTNEQLSTSNVPTYETENSSLVNVDMSGDVAPTSGKPIETSQTEAFSPLRYTCDYNQILGQGVKQSEIALQEENSNKTVSLAQRDVAKQLQLSE